MAAKRIVFVTLEVLEDTDIFNLHEELADQTGLDHDDIVIYETVEALVEDHEPTFGLGED